MSTPPINNRDPVPTVSVGVLPPINEEEEVIEVSTQPQPSTSYWSIVTSLPQKAVSGVKSLFKPIDFMGQRYTLPYTSQPFPKDPYFSLEGLNTSIEEFEKIHQTSPVLNTISPPIVAPVTTPTASHAAAEVHNADVALNQLNAHLSNFSVLYALHWAIGKNLDDEREMNAIFEMTRASIVPDNQPQPNLKQLILNKYTNLSFFRRVCLWAVHRLCTFRGFVQKTIDGVTHRILNEIRAHFTQALLPPDGSEGRLIPKLIEDGTQFLKLYRQAIQDHARETPLFDIHGIQIHSPSLDQRKEIAIQKFYGKTLHAFSKDISQSFLRHLFPQIEYQSGATWLNPIMNKLARWFLNRQLPDLLETSLKKSTEQIKPHKLPFVKGIIQALTIQLTDFKVELESNTIDPPQVNFPGTQNLPDFVEHFLSVLDYGENPTQQQILQIMNRPTEPLDQHIRSAVVKPLNLFLYYLVKPENQEKCLSKMFELLRVPFDAPQRVTQQEVDRLNDDLLGLAKTVFEEAVKQAVEEEIRGVNPNKIEHFANDQFKMRKEHISSCLARITDLRKKLDTKMERLSLAEVESIYRDLIELKELLKILRAEEKKAEKELKLLSQAEQEAILRPLLPVYQQAQLLMQQILEMQRTLLAFHSECGREEHLKSLKEHLGALNQNKLLISGTIKELLDLSNTAPILTRLAMAEHVEKLDQRIGEILGRLSILQPINSSLTEEERIAYQRFLAAFAEMREQHQQLILLQRLDGSLRSFLARENQRNAVALINEYLAKTSKQDRERLQPLIASLRPPVNAYEVVAFQPTNQRITQILEEIQRRAIQNLNRANATVVETSVTIQGHVERISHINHDQELIITNQMKAISQNLGASLTDLSTQVAQSAKEEQYHITRRLDNLIGIGTMGLGALASYAHPLLGMAVALFGSVSQKLPEIGRVLSPQQPAENRLADGAKVLGRVAAETLAVGLLPGRLVGVVAPGWAATASIVTTAGAAGLAGRAGIGNTVTGGKNYIVPRVMEIMGNAYQLIRTKFIYDGAIKIGLAQVLRSYPATT